MCERKDKMNQLQRQLRSIDHRGYPAYKDLRGTYRFGKYTLNIEHVQGDPFASPSKLQGALRDFPRNIIRIITGG